MPRKRALVLGGGGFLGHALVKRLVEENYWVRAIDLSRPKFFSSPANDFVIDDLRRVRDPKAFLGFDEVYHCAYPTGDANEVLRSSSMINGAVLSVFQTIGFPDVLFFPSSIDPAPDKVFAEKLFSAHGARIARLTYLYGPGNSSRTNLINQLCRTVVRANGHLNITGDPNQRLHYLHINDAVDAVLAFVRSSKSFATISNQQYIALQYLVRILLGSHQTDLTFTFSTLPEAHAPCDLDWAPRVDFLSGLTETMAWVRRQSP